jgi:hypothetical protein
MKEIKVNSAVLRTDDNDIKDMSELTIGSPVVVFAKGYSDWSICPGIVTALLTMDQIFVCHCRYYLQG